MPIMNSFFFGFLVMAAWSPAASTYTIELLATDADCESGAPWSYYGDDSSSVDISFIDWLVMVRRILVIRSALSSDE